MTIVSIHNDNPLIDGRQSDRAMTVRRGVQRMLTEMRHAVLPELTLASGRRADLISLSDKGEIWIVEIKSSLVDFRVDAKWPNYKDYCDRFYFAKPPELDADIFPADDGLMAADLHGAEILRAANEHPVAPARRKAMLLKLVRLGADRVHFLMDPQSSGDPSL